MASAHLSHRIYQDNGLFNLETASNCNTTACKGDRGRRRVFGFNSKQQLKLLVLLQLVSDEGRAVCRVYLDKGLHDTLTLVPQQLLAQGGTALSCDP